MFIHETAHQLPLGFRQHNQRTVYLCVVSSFDTACEYKLSFCMCVSVFVGAYDRPLLVLFVNTSAGSRGEKGMRNHLTSEIPAGLPLAVTDTHSVRADHCVIDILSL